MKWYVLRQIYRMDCTAGIYIVNDRWFCYTLELPTRRAGEVKVPGKTAIPAGVYLLQSLYSPHFQRNTPHIMDVPNFTEIEQHGGDTAADTEGCTLLEYTRVNDCTIYGGGKIPGSMATAEGALNALLQQAQEDVFCEIVDTQPGFGL